MVLANPEPANDYILININISGFFVRYIYSFITYLLLPFVVLRLFWSSLRSPEYRRRWPERFGFVAHSRDKPVIWLHAVSVGEVQAAGPLIHRLLDSYPDHCIVVTTLTPTGARTLEQRFAGSVTHYYLPYDISWAVKAFLKRLRPVILIVMETEIWPNLFYYSHRQDVPIAMVNARLSARSAAGYARIASLTSRTLQCVSLIAAQSRDDAKRLIQLGAAADGTVVTGNLKFDIRMPHSIREQAEVLRRELSVNRPVWIAASTHEGEEKLVLDALARLREIMPDNLLMIAPRHPERFDRVAELCRRRGYKLTRRSQHASVQADTAIYLVDSLGELPICYAAADVAFVGGSLVPIGGHNMLEPASLGVPILTGPHVFNFREIAGVLSKAGAAWEVADATELADQVQKLFNDANLRFKVGQCGREIVDANTGAAEQIMHLLDEHMRLNPD